MCITIMVKTVIFTRVSTNVQKYDRQVNKLTVLTKSNAWSVEDFGNKGKY